MTVTTTTVFGTNVNRSTWHVT